MFFCKHCKNYRDFTQSSGVEILRKRTVSEGPWAIYPENLWKLSADGKLLTRKLEEIPSYSGSGSYVCYYLLLFFIQRRFKFYNKIFLI